MPDRKGPAMANEDIIAPLPRVTVQAFCETQVVADAISEAIADRRMSRAHVKVLMGGGVAAVEAFRQSPTPNILVIEGNSARDEVIQRLDELAECCDPGTKVVVIGHYNDVALYRELMARGVSDYLVAPVDPIEFVRALSQLYAGAESKAVGRMIAVTGAKGGVGASTICHNVAFLISERFDSPTILVDMDLPFGTAGLDFNQDPATGIGDLIKAPAPDATLLDRVLTRCTPKLSILSAPVTLENGGEPDETRLQTILDLVRAATSTIVLDVPHLWTGLARQALTSADEIILVTAPDLAGLRNTKMIYDILRAARPNDAKPRVVINMSGVPRRLEITLNDFARAIEDDPVCLIPFDPKIFGAAANNGQMLAEMSDAAKINETLVELAGVVMGRTESRPVKTGGLLAPLTALLGRAKAS